MNENEDQNDGTIAVMGSQPGLWGKKMISNLITFIGKMSKYTFIGKNVDFQKGLLRLTGDIFCNETLFVCDLYWLVELNSMS